MPTSRDSNRPMARCSIYFDSISMKNAEFVPTRPFAWIKCRLPAAGRAVEIPLELSSRQRNSMLHQNAYWGKIYENSDSICSGLVAKRFRSAGEIMTSSRTSRRKKGATSARHLIDPTSQPPPCTSHSLACYQQLAPCPSAPSQYPRRAFSQVDPLTLSTSSGAFSGTSLSVDRHARCPSPDWSSSYRDRCA